MLFLKENIGILIEGSCEIVNYKLPLLLALYLVQSTSKRIEATGAIGLSDESIQTKTQA